MKQSQKLLLGATLASIAVAQSTYMPKDIFDYSQNFFLNDQDALDYLFQYDPARLHADDLPWTDANPDTQLWNYDNNYFWRMCHPRAATLESVQHISPADLVAQLSPDLREIYDNTDEDDKMALLATPEFARDLGLFISRASFSGSEFPCERRNWIIAECGALFSDEFTPEEQNKCLCDSGFFQLNEACIDCHGIHMGNITWIEESYRVMSAASRDVCVASPTVTIPLNDYVTLPIPGTIFLDEAQNQTAVSLYYTGAVDFIASTIQSPQFTRTVDGTTMVMTPGVQGAHPTPSSSAATSTSTTSTSSNSTSSASSSSSSTFATSTSILASPTWNNGTGPAVPVTSSGFAAPSGGNGHGTNPDVPVCTPGCGGHGTGPEVPAGSHPAAPGGGEGSAPGGGDESGAGSGSDADVEVPAGINGTLTSTSTSRVATPTAGAGAEESLLTGAGVANTVSGGIMIAVLGGLLMI